MLDMQRLRLLREFSIRGTISEVADVLSYSASGVSQQLAQLERETGRTLLRRVGRGLELTPAGERLVAESEALFQQLERVEASLQRGRDELTGTIRVAVFQSAMISLMPKALTALAETHPGLRVEVVQHEPETALYETWARGFDVVVAEQYPGHAAPHHEGLGRSVLGSDAIMLAVPEVHPERFAGVRSVLDAAGVPWVMEPEGSASRHWALQACRSAGFEPDLRYETADIQAHLRLVEAGNAVALVNGLSVRHYTGRVRLVDLPSSPRREIFVARREASEDHPAFAAVMEALGEVAAGLRL
ncbi:LysR family transcriptional regulator [Leucobacter sp. UCMA 4100]|uniref:LysR family transcriptional regulator n=1 Tax=Leucobacter sp. UCMA 4100 TaxID=2810534 RepID=UPI0022EB7F25|nr:LysR family transcriptional regulator [Leucobacter sp. UCMA 4100]MDA3147715.1 LysR family transcriptional regulator [Leucobacter sp. UCMA 4100]